MATSLSPGPKQKFYTRWQSKIPDDSDLYGARPSHRQVLVRDVTSGEEILLTKLEFDTGEVLSQAKQDWVNKLDGHALQLTQIQRQAYNKTVSHDNNMHNIIFETDSQEEMSTMNKTSKFNTKYK